MSERRQKDEVKTIISILPTPEKVETLNYQYPIVKTQKLFIEEIFS